MNNSPLLINEPPLQVLPSLATAIGLNEAIALQQIHYWITHNERQSSTHHYRDERWWTYNSYENWKAKNFPFWSVATIKRTFKSLESQGLVLTAKMGKDPRDQTKWYTIDYEKLSHVSQCIGSNCTNGKDQNDPMEEVNLTQSSIYTETNYPETNTQKLTATTPQSEGSGSDVCPLASQWEEDDEALKAEIKENAEHLVSVMRNHGLHVTVTKTVLKACEGKTYERAMLNAIAVVEKAAMQPIRQPQGALTKALQDDWAPSLAYFRKGLSDYGRKIYLAEFLKAAKALGYVKAYEFAGQNYMWQGADGEIMIAEYGALPWINGNECGLGALWEELKYLNEVA